MVLPQFPGRCARHTVRPGTVPLAAVAVGALATVLIIQQRRNGTVTRSLAGARVALDRALAQLPSASQVRKSIEGIHMPAVRMPDLKSFLKRR